MKCTIKYFDVSTGEAVEHVFDNVDKQDDIKGGKEDSLLIYMHDGKVLQIPDHKLISVIIE